MYRSLDDRGYRTHIYREIDSRHMGPLSPDETLSADPETDGLWFELRASGSRVRTFLAGQPSARLEAIGTAIEATWADGAIDGPDRVDSGVELTLPVSIDRLFVGERLSLSAVHPADRSAVESALERLAEGTPIAGCVRIDVAGLEAGGTDDRDGPGRSSSESYRVVRIDARPIGLGSDRARIVGTARDVTDRQQRIARLERENERIGKLHEVATEISAMTDPEVVYHTTIEATEDILEFDICTIDIESAGTLRTVAVASDMSIDDYYHEVPTDPDETMAGKTYCTGDSYVVDDIADTGYAPAQPRYRSVLSVPIGNHGVFQAAAERTGAFDETDLRTTELLMEQVAAALDRIEREAELTERTEELEAQNRRLDEFTGFVSHDIRSPLNVAMGRLDMAAETVDDEDLDRARAALDRIDDLIEDVLALARQGRTIGETEPVDLGSLARACWEGLDTAGATLSVEVDGSIRADPDRVRQALENLFRNSIEHGARNSPHHAIVSRSKPREADEEDVDVSVRIGELPDGFYVEDDGPGIPPDEREQIFEAGYTTDPDGTGLGLRIVEEIVEAHDWTIEATEGEAGGARFEIRGVEWIKHA